MNSRTAITPASSATTNDPLMSRSEYRYKKYDNITIAMPPRSEPSGRMGLARGTGAGGAGGAVAGAAASAPIVVNAAPQYRQKREVSLFIVPHASQRIVRSRARIPASGL